MFTTVCQLPSLTSLYKELKYNEYMYDMLSKRVENNLKLNRECRESDCGNCIYREKVIKAFSDSKKYFKLKVDKINVAIGVYKI